MDIAYCRTVCAKSKAFAFLATNCDGFFVEQERHTATIKITLDLAQPLSHGSAHVERGLATHRYGCGIIAMSSG
jgi:hypothetical protein